MEVNVERVVKTFAATGAPIAALAGVDFTVSCHELVAILGPSGCGKSTLLDIIAGLSPSTQGRVWIGGSPVVAPMPDCAILFQEGGLFPWLTAEGNLRFALRMHRVPRQNWQSLCVESLERFDLLPFASVFPRQLSGGMKQRLALARAMISGPRVLLLDEPFAAVDAITRRRLQIMLLQRLRDSPRTVLLVTHSFEEALLLADRIIVLSARPGVVKKVVRVPGEAGPKRLLDPRVMLLQEELWSSLEE